MISFLKSLFLFTAALLFSASVFAKPVALNIFLADGGAIRVSTAEVIEKIYARYAPEVAFRQVLIETGSVNYTPAQTEKVREELKAKLAAALEPGDELQFLIIDTHANTTANHFSALQFLGGFSATEIGAKFREMFDPLKPYVSKNLSVIINGCNVFEDGEEAAVARSKNLLNYFGATDGFVYGSKVAEDNALEFQLGHRPLKSFLKDYRFAAAYNFVLSTTMATFMAWHYHSLAIGQTFFAATAWILPFGQFLLSYGTNKSDDLKEEVNRGYLVEIHDGELHKVEFIQKMKDLKKSFGLGGLKSLRCEAIFRTPYLSGRQ